ESEDCSASTSLVVGELLRRALPAEVSARVRDGAAVAAILPVEPQVLLFLAHGRGHTGKSAHDLRLDVAAEVEELAVVRERHPGRELRRDRPVEGRQGERVGALEEERLGAAAVGDDEDLVAWLAFFQRRRQAEQARR